MAIADFDAYRQRHWEHHRSLGTDADPKYVYHTSIEGRRLFTLLVKCLVLFEPARRFSMNFRGNTGEPSEPTDDTRDPKWPLRAAVFHLVLTASLAGLALLVRDGSPIRIVMEAAIAYGIVYLYGLAAVTVFFASLRAIAEHQIGADNAPHQNDAALRNFKTNFFTQWLFGAYGFADHYTHHLKPAIPYYNLPRATQEMSAAEPALVPVTSYPKTLRALMRSGEHRPE
jgi:fatty acid desaturase